MWFPTAAQVELLQAVGRRICFRHGNKVGGTSSSLRWVAEHLRGHSPWRAIPQGKRRGILLTTTWTNVREDVTPLLLQHLPEGLIAPQSRWSKGGYPQSGGWPLGKCVMRNGNELLFRVIEGKQVNKAGFAAHFAMLNEPPDPDSYNEIVRALAAYQDGGHLLINACMVGRDMQWLEHLVEGAPDEAKLERTAPVGRYYQPAVRGWTSLQVPFASETAPWLTPEAHVMIRSSYLPHEVTQRVEAGWRGSVHGALISGYTSAQYAYPPDWQRRDWNIGLGVDWGDGPRCYLCLVAWDVDACVVVDEWLSRESSDAGVVAHHAKVLLDRQGLSTRDVDKVVGDSNKAALGYSASMNELLAQGLRVRVDKPRKGAGSVMYRARLLHAAASRGKFWVLPGCTVADRAIRSWTGGDDEHKHPCDAIGYVLHQGLEGLLSEQQLNIMRII